MGYQTDLVAALKKEAELIKKQTILELISIATACDDYTEFKKAMYGVAIQYFKEMEADGLVPVGTVDKVINSKQTEDDSGILL